MVHPDFYGDITGTGTLRTEPVDDETRGPDSVECSPGSPYAHTQCAFDFTNAPNGGFLCVCVCHDNPDTPTKETGHAC